MGEGAKHTLGFPLGRPKPFCQLQLILFLLCGHPDQPQPLGEGAAAAGNAKKSLPVFQQQTEDMPVKILKGFHRQFSGFTLDDFKGRVEQQPCGLRAGYGKTGLPQLTIVGPEPGMLPTGGGQAAFSCLQNQPAEVPVI